MFKCLNVQMTAGQGASVEQAGAAVADRDGTAARPLCPGMFESLKGLFARLECLFTRLVKRGECIKRSKRFEWGGEGAAVSCRLVFLKCLNVVRERYLIIRMSFFERCDIGV